MMFNEHSLHEVMGLRRNELPFDKPITPAEMRIGMVRATYYNNVMRIVNNIAEKQGLSGEDKYTALAFYAMLQLESMTANYLRFSEQVTSQPPVFVAEKGLKGG